jgi:hypothetical protein
MSQKVKKQVLASLFHHQPLSAAELFRESNHHSYHGFSSALSRLVVLGFLVVDRRGRPFQYTLSAYGEATILADASLVL